MYRTHNCGELNLNNKDSKVTLSGWVQKVRLLGGMNFIDLRDRYGITQVTCNQDINNEIFELSKQLGREFVIQIEGIVKERSSKNNNIPTGEIEIEATHLKIINSSKTPPFTIEEKTDGGEDIRMKYRYLDLRRKPLQEKIILRSKMSAEIRSYLTNQDFLEIETPFLIKSTPEGARDFVVPSRMNENEFYALPQSPQTFKQLLMVSGYDKYFQIVRCFRDEDLRADRQPEFTQLDCEMSFVDQESILNTFEGLMKHMFQKFLNVNLNDFPRMTYEDAMAKYGSDKPDTRFNMQFVELNEQLKNKGFVVFDKAELVVGINAEGCSSYSRKQLDKLTDFVKKPQVGAQGLVYIKYNEDGTFKSSVDKFFNSEQLQEIAKLFNAKPGDLMLVLAGNKDKTRKALNELRLEMGSILNLRDPKVFSPLWVIDFPLLEHDEETDKWHAMHHPFTSPKKEDIHLLDTAPEQVKANAYDLVVNGVEIGGGSIRIHERELQQKMFSALGFTEQEAEEQFGFLLGAFEYGAPPHGGIAFGFDRWAALFSGVESIRDCIAFPKNNSGRDVMLNAPASINNEQLKELNLSLASEN